MATCPTCEAEFTPKSNHHPVQRYCGRACKERGAARRRRAPIVQANRAAREAAREVVPKSRVCTECAAEYVGRRWRYCSDACAGLGAWRQNLARYGTTPEDVAARGCEHCGGSKPSMRHRVCDSCREIVEREEKRRARRVRKMRKRGVASEPYTLAEIAQRDRYRCGLCRKRVAMTQVVPHSKAPTIDHVLPLAVGGHDVRANVQLAHFLCNSIKGAHGAQQLMLIG